jgi:hypothetical protein
LIVGRDMTTSVIEVVLLTLAATGNQKQDAAEFGRP